MVNLHHVNFLYIDIVSGFVIFNLNLLTILLDAVTQQYELLTEGFVMDLSVPHSPVPLVLVSSAVRNPVSFSFLFATSDLVD